MYRIKTLVSMANDLSEVISRAKKWTKENLAVCCASVHTSGLKVLLPFVPLFASSLKIVSLKRKIAEHQSTYSAHRMS